jgi:hypothetical protein
VANNTTITKKKDYFGMVPVPSKGTTFGAQLHNFFYKELYNCLLQSQKGEKIT